ncbi:MAG TPA: hypothetical protein GX497_12875 [Bacillus bacterium]|nr:hypothetical protein [Bacillus sp. (in: firmicutes)]
MNEQILQQILNQMTAMQEEFKGIKNEMKTRFDHLDSEVFEIKEAVHRIELSQPEDILSLMEQIRNKLEDKTEVLNKRVYNVETEVQRLSRQ